MDVGGEEHCDGDAVLAGSLPALQLDESDTRPLRGSPVTRWLPSAFARELSQGSHSRLSPEPDLPAKGFDCAATPAPETTGPALDQTLPPPLADRQPSGFGGPGRVMTNFETTFRVMTHRRLQRELQGTYSKPQPGRTVSWILLFVALEAGLASVSFQSGFNVQISVGSNLAALLLNMGALYIALRVVSVVRWCLFWIGAGSCTMILLSSNPALLEWLSPGAGDDALGFASSLVGSATGFLITVTLLVWVSYHKLYPAAVRRGWLCLGNIASFFSIAPLSDGHYTYKLPHPWLGRPCCRTLLTFGYTGEVDEEGRPHGVGMWTDEATHGESLQGLWRHGEPIGPFRASEFGSDYRFSNVRLAFVTNRAEPEISQAWWRPGYSEELMWGIASFECSIAGAWFKNLPVVRPRVVPRHRPAPSSRVVPTSSRARHSPLDACSCAPPTPVGGSDCRPLPGSLCRVVPGTVGHAKARGPPPLLHHHQRAGRQAARARV